MRRLTVCIALLVAAPLYVWSMAALASPQIPALEYGNPKPPFQNGSMLFVGDIMLARHVERLSDTHGSLFGFANLIDDISAVNVAVGNLEGSIPATHVPTPNFTFRFSIPEELLFAAKESGFDVLSLANNHTYDHGDEGFLHTVSACAETVISCFGHPLEIATSSITVTEVGETSVGILAIHATTKVPTQTDIERWVGVLVQQSDIQFAYIHWGDEYMLTHNEVQAKLAYALIDVGIDAIFGHHPHVVQDIELYQGKPIFYSLGNFIFDQYFNDDVQTGLTVRVDVLESELHYSLHPVSSLTSRSQPQWMRGGDGDELIQRITAGYRTAFTYASSTAQLRVVRTPDE